jgi:hypothetical protein
MELVRGLGIACVLACSCGRGNFEVDATDAPKDSTAGATANIAFVTSTTYLPTTFGNDLSGADAFCAARATSAGLPGHYVALLSTPSIAARDRIAGARGWIRPDGMPFADRPEDVTSGKIYYPLEIDENGADVGYDVVATGSNPDGTDSFDCVGYTDAASSLITGYTGGTTDEWIDYRSDSCGNSFRLYCFGIDRASALTVQPATGRRAFVTVQTFAPTAGGTADADALCANDALLAGIPGTFGALLETSSAGASTRFALGGANWVRLDGIPIAASPLAFMNQDWHTSLNVSSIGDYTDEEVFTGARDATLLAPAANDTCSDWTTPSNTATIGRSAYINSGAIDASTGAACSSPRSIYCLEL